MDMIKNCSQGVARERSALTWATFVHAPSAHSHTPPYALISLPRRPASCPEVLRSLLPREAREVTCARPFCRWRVVMMEALVTEVVSLQLPM